MAQQVFKSPKIWVGQYEADPDTYATTWAMNVEAVDDTTFGDTTRSRASGLATTSFVDRLYWNGGTGNGDDLLNGLVGSVNVPRIVAPVDGTEGNDAYLSQFLVARYSPVDGGEVGAMHAVQVEGQNNGSPPVRGVLVANKTGVSASGNGTAYQVGAVTAGQRMYAAVSVTGVSASDTIDITIESDTSGFASATTQLTFPQFTDEGYGFLFTDGTAITDDYWRVAYTVGGAGVSIDFAVAIGIW